MTWNSTLKASTKPMQRTQMKHKSIKAKPADEDAAHWLKQMKSRGMKGAATTVEQKRFHSLLADVVGCIACRQEGGYTNLVSIHHIDGRTKPHAHWTVIPLCGPHHQDMGVNGVIPVHPYKARFEATYGTQMELLRRSIQILIDGGFMVPDGALAAAGMEKDCPASVPADRGVAHNGVEI